jgi:hypothetical protein
MSALNGTSKGRESNDETVHSQSAQAHFQPAQAHFQPAQAQTG